MTDLVQKLVGALDAFVERFKDHEDTGPRGEMWQSDEFLAELAQARAALSEAKAGGWQDISTAPDGTMILCANMNAREARDWCFVAWMAGGKVCGYRMDKPTHWQPLPAPPAQRGEG